MPFFSVILPVYNREKFIAKAVDSVLNQTYTDFELILVDDASIDNTAQIIQSYHDSRIRYVRNDINIERCNSRNRGIAMARGTYICFLDSDDYHLPHHLQTLYSHILERQNPTALFFTNSWNLYNNELQERPCPDITHYNVFEYIGLYTFNPQRMCIHSSIIQQFVFDPAVYVCEDLDLAARIATQYPVMQIQERTTVYVHHAESFTGGDSRKAFKELENYKRIFAKPELRKRFPVVTKRKLLSMCYFHIAQYCNTHRELSCMYSAIIRSFVLYPPGYNGKTNKILLVLFLYNIPLLGTLFQKILGNRK